MTIKFLKQWGLGYLNSETRAQCQRLLDGGAVINRPKGASIVYIVDPSNPMRTVVCPLKTKDGKEMVSNGEAVKFAAALNKLRRPLHLIKQDLDKDWAARVKERDNNTCALCGIQGDKVNASKKGKDVLTAHHWFKTKSRAGMARWSRACGVTVHFAEHIHLLHENPCWVDLDGIYDKVEALEGIGGIVAARIWVAVEPTEARVRRLWLERCGNCNT